MVIYQSPNERKNFDVKAYTNKHTNSNTNHNDFYEISEEAKKYVLKEYDKKIEQKSKGEIQEDYAKIYHDAMIGIPSAVNLIKNIIEEFVVEQNYREVKYPEYYPNLIDALFEESFGWGPLSVFRYIDSEAAQVLGTNIKIKRSWGWETQPFKFRNIERVLELANNFSNSDSRHVLNAILKPELETETADNNRVSIMIPERVYREPVITLRRKRIKTLTFEKLSELKTFPKDVIPIFETLSRFWLFWVIAGPPGSGKSTLLHTMLHYMLYEYREGKKVAERYNTIYAESYPEFHSREIHPDSNVLHLIGNGEDFEKTIMTAILRHDISRIALGEIREHEVGLYKSAALRGIRSVIGTLHDLDPVDIPKILTDLYLQYYTHNSDPKSIYETFLKSVHLSISTDEVLIGDTLEKKVVSIQFYDVDSENNVKIHKIMDYDYENNSWTFKSYIPERIEKIMKKTHAKEFERLKAQLKKLESKECV